MAGYMHLIDLILKLGTLATLLVGGIAVYIAVRNNSRQLAAQIFLTYSDRLRAVRRSAANDFSRPEAILEAVYLIFEFHSLRRRGYVPNPVWRIWEADMTDLLNTAAFVDLWPKMQPRFENHPHFLAWVAERHRVKYKRPTHTSLEAIYDPCVPLVAEGEPRP
jgi:hypothetical protein